VAEHQVRENAKMKVYLAGPMRGCENRGQAVVIADLFDSAA
jgi:hypothetical protein